MSRTSSRSTTDEPSGPSPKSAYVSCSSRTAIRAKKLSTSFPSYSLVPVTPTSASRLRSTGARSSACALSVATRSAVMCGSHTHSSAPSASLVSEMTLPSDASLSMSACSSALANAWSLAAAAGPSPPARASLAANALASRTYHSLGRTVGLPVPSRNCRPYEPAPSSVFPRAVSANATRDSSATCFAQGGSRSRYTCCSFRVRVSALLASSTMPASVMTVVNSAAAGEGPTLNPGVPLAANRGRQRSTTERRARPCVSDMAAIIITSS
eukprot:scaffold1443_cov116-Isochrysis_galbana.AAC.8